MAKVLIGNFKGPKGDKGDKGDPGTAASIQVGTTQTVQPEENAEVNNTGTTTAAVLNFKIPRGKDGMTDLTAEYKDASSYTCQPTVNAPVVVKELEGKTEQVQNDGQNIYDSSSEQSGYVDGNNGNIINASSHNEKYTDYQAIEEFKTQIKVKINITIPSGIVNGTWIGVGFYDSNKNFILRDTLSKDHSQGGNFTEEKVMDIPQNAKFMRISYRKYSNGELSVAYWPYPAPSPDYPQVIKGVGGMGFFDGAWRQGGYNTDNGSDTTLSYVISSANKIACNPSDNIKIKYYGDTNYVALVFYKSDGTFLSGVYGDVLNEVAEYEYTVPANASYFVFNIQNEASNPITPSTAKYCTVTINGEYQTGVEVHGAQLFDMENYDFATTRCTISKSSDYIIFTATAADAYFGDAIAPGRVTNQEVLPVSPNTEYTVTISNNYFTKNYISFLDSNKTGIQNYLEFTSQSQSFTIPDNCAYILLRFGNSNSVNGDTERLQIMLNKGSTAIPWEPYHRTALSIPLTSPLYEGDKICYVKPGESYVDAEGETVIADRILYGCYRENAVVVFDGSEDENIGKSTDGENTFSCTITNKVGSSIGGEQYLKCNKLTTTATNVSASNMPDNSIKESSEIGSNAVILNISEAGTTVESLRAWLSTNPLTVVYRLAQPYFKPFADQAPFYTLRTDDTLSYVYSSDPIEPVLTVEVAKNSTGGYLLESYAQAQKNAISEANSQSRISAIEQQLVNQATTPTE